MKNSRNELAIKMDFKKLGYQIEVDNSLFLRMRIKEDKDPRILLIHKQTKCYEKYIILDLLAVSLEIDIKEHILLNELFNLWGWINEEH